MKELRLEMQPDPEQVEYDEEREGLLSGKENSNEAHDTTGEHDIPRGRVYLIAAVLVVLMLGAVFAPPLLKSSRPQADFDSQKLRSNGTHTFRKTSLIVSIDGLR